MSIALSRILQEMENFQAKFAHSSGIHGSCLATAFWFMLLLAVRSAPKIHLLVLVRKNALPANARSNNAVIFQALIVVPFPRSF